MKRMVKWINAAFVLFALAGAACAQPYPDRPVQMIVPFAPGGSLDVIARILQPALGAQLAQPIVILNRPGASGTIGTSAVVAAKPDGYTLGILAMGSTAILPHFRKLSYDLDSFDYICQIYSAPVLIMVGENSPYHDIKSLLAFAKANPKRLFYGSPGVGTPDHINMASFLRANGVTGTHVPYPGSGAASTALLTGELTALSNTSVLMRAHKLRPLVVLSAKRLDELPDVPTAGEVGPPMEASIWAVMVAPKGLPTDVRKRLETACRNALDDPAYKASAEKGGFPPLYRDGDATKAFVQSEFAKYGPIVKAEGIELQ
jgi:tripartite-type tricarboxylate transporter receptor subunit TctC